MVRARPSGDCEERRPRLAERVLLVLRTEFTRAVLASAFGSLERVDRGPPCVARTHRDKPEVRDREHFVEQPSNVPRLRSELPAGRAIEQA